MVKKSKKDTMSNVAFTSITTSVAVGTVAPLAPGATTTQLQTDFGAGVSKVGSTLPTIGKLKGTGMVLKQVKKLKYKSKKTL